MACGGSRPLDKSSTEFSHGVETCSSISINLKVFQQSLTGIVDAKCTTCQLPVDCAFSDFASGATREQIPRPGRASVTIVDVLGKQVHPVQLGTGVSDF